MQTINAHYHNLLQELYDSINRLTEFAEHTQASPFKSFLLASAEARKAILTQLKQVMIIAGEVPAEYGTLTGPLHHLFLDLKHLITKQDTNAIKNEILRRDESLINSYKQAIIDESEGAAKEMLSSQLKQIHNELARISDAALFEAAVSN